LKGCKLDNFQEMQGQVAGDKKVGTELGKVYDLGNFELI
jgi:hypothetical protein